MFSLVTKKQSNRPLIRNFSLTMTNIKCQSPIRTSKQVRYAKNVNRLYSSTKSLKSLQNQIQKVSPNRDTMEKILFIKKQGIQTHQIKQLQKIRNRLPYHVVLKEKMIKLTKSLLLELQIFKKIQSTVRRQKSVISKLYGWDQKFANIFFSGEDIKVEINFQQLQKTQLFGRLSRNDSQFKCLYNKMRLFQAELRDFNIRQQDLNVEVKKKSLHENIDKFIATAKKFQMPDRQNQEILKKVRSYSPNRNKKSLKNILQMNDCQKQLGLEDFEFKFGQDLDKLQTIIEAGYRKIGKFN